MEHVNFYENIQEAKMRLRGTVVLYDGLPYFVHAVTDHKSDGIFRVYLQLIEELNTKICKIFGQIPYDHSSTGDVVDKWMKENPDSGLLRKHMNSPLFNRFKPFPLGMCNLKGTHAYYVERQPNRKTEQGLISSMLYQSVLSCQPNDGKPGIFRLDMFTNEFKACILGTHPTAERCLKELLDPKTTNESVAFHREFAIVRGPIETFFLAYKGDVVGILPHKDFSVVQLGRDFTHTKEVVAELNLFKDIRYTAR